MPVAQRAVVLALDEPSRAITQAIAGKLRDYRLSDGKPFPEVLWREAWVAGGLDAARASKDAKRAGPGGETAEAAVIDVALSPDALRDVP